HVRPAPAGHARDVLAEQRDRAGVGGQLACNEVKQRGLAGAVRSDDQTALAGLHVEVDAASDAQAAERFRQGIDGERAHGFASVLPAGVPPSLRRARRHSRAEPGTNPSGIRMTMATKIAPSSMFQRSIKPLTTLFTTTTSAAPTIGPSRVP